MDYEQKKQLELNQYSHLEVLEHDGMPGILPYWSEKFRPICEAAGIPVGEEFRVPMRDMCRSRTTVVQAVSFGTGICEHEIRLAQSLLDDGISNFHIECLEFNPDLCERARQRIAEKGLTQYLTPVVQDVNNWHPTKMYDFVIGAWAFHHFVELEQLFDEIKAHMNDDALFVMSDVVGRNGHVRWPEVTPIMNELWKAMPEKYKFNHQSGQLDVDTYFDADCSLSGFEGIRAQDILPLLLERFSFRNFAGYSCISEKFYERAYGDNFSPDNAEDRVFIDSVAALEESLISLGMIKPARMTAIMTKTPVAVTQHFKHWTPEFCVRYPDGWVQQSLSAEFNGITVVMAVQNGIESTLQAMESILTHSFQPVRFVIVDNGSSDGTSDLLAQVPEGVTVIKNASPVATEQAWTQGIEAAEGHYVVIASNDVRATEGWLESIIYEIDNDKSVAVSPVLIGSDGLRSSSHGFDDLQGVCLVADLAACKSGEAKRAVLAQRSIVMTVPMKVAQNAN